MTNINVKSAKNVEIKTTSVSERFMWIFNTIFHQLVAVVGVFILWTLFYTFENTLSRWHMILTAVAYLPLMSEAIVLFASDNVWTQNIKRTTRYYIHGAFMFCSAVLATVGIAFMINAKIQNSSTTHFKSTHAWTGLVSWILVLLSQITGVASAKSYSLKAILRPVWFKFLHNFFGLSGYVFGLTSLCYGLRKSTFRENTTEESRAAAIALIAIVTGWSVIAAFKSVYSQLKSIVS